MSNFKNFKGCHLKDEAIYSVNMDAVKELMVKENQSPGNRGKYYVNIQFLSGETPLNSIDFESKSLARDYMQDLVQ
jgi:hypothetical protein